MPPILYLILIRRNGSAYPEVTQANLPSSLMIVHSNAFVYSTCLPVMVSRHGHTRGTISFLEIASLLYFGTWAYCIFQHPITFNKFYRVNLLVKVFPQYTFSHHLIPLDVNLEAGEFSNSAQGNRRLRPKPLVHD